MALILQVTVVNDETGEVEKTYIETVGQRTDPWEAARSIRTMMARVFAAIYGPDCDEW